MKLIACLLLLFLAGCGGSQFSRDMNRAWQGTKEYFSASDSTAIAIDSTAAQPEADGR